MDVKCTDMKIKVYSLTVILMFITILTGCSPYKTVSIDETKEFTKTIMDSNEKITNLEFRFKRPALYADINYKGDLEKGDFQYLINEFQTIIDIDFMQKIGDEYWNGSRPSGFKLRIHIGEDKKDGYDYIIYSKYNKTKVSNEEPDNIDGYETWYIFDRDDNKIKID